MKYKKKLENLRLAQIWWDKQPADYQRSTTRPGSIKQSIIRAKK